MNKAEEFNKIRRIIFSTFHKYGATKAFEYLEGYKTKLGSQSYIGLKAELEFYNNYRNEFKLSVSADVGDHTDFSGQMNSEIYRFDVTTNANYKKLKDYEPLQKDLDAKYKIAIMNQNGTLDEVVDINFPFCPECEKGRLMDIGVLLGENYNASGESLWTNDQILIGACSSCQYFVEQQRISTHFLFDYNTEIKNAIDALQSDFDYMESIGEKIDIDLSNVITTHTQNVLPYLHRQFDKTLMGLGERHFKIINPKDGDGQFQTRLLWMKELKMFENYLLDEYDFDIS